MNPNQDCAICEGEGVQYFSNGLDDYDVVPCGCTETILEIEAEGK